MQLCTEYLNGGNWYNATPAFMPTILASNVLNTSELLAEHSLTASGGVVENTAYATTITDKSGTTTAQISDGVNGAPGADGFSPTATVTQTASGATISITDKTGTTTATVSNGQDGSPGQPGTDGTDGVSPMVTVTDITGGHRVTITDAEHSTGQTFDVMNGQDGQPGTDGAPGVGVPSGGTDGQMLVKDGSTDYATKWQNQPFIVGE